jgi:hypothetical protein
MACKYIGFTKYQGCYLDHPMSACAATEVPDELVARYEKLITEFQDVMAELAERAEYAKEARGHQ